METNQKSRRKRAQSLKRKRNQYSTERGREQNRLAQKRFRYKIKIEKSLVQDEMQHAQQKVHTIQQKLLRAEDLLLEKRMEIDVLSAQLEQYRNDLFSSTDIEPGNLYYLLDAISLVIYDSYSNANRIL